MGLPPRVTTRLVPKLLWAVVFVLRVVICMAEINLYRA